MIDSGDNGEFRAGDHAKQRKGMLQWEKLVAVAGNHEGGRGDFLEILVRMGMGMAHLIRKLPQHR